MYLKPHPNWIKAPNIRIIYCHVLASKSKLFSLALAFSLLYACASPPSSPPPPTTTIDAVAILNDDIPQLIENGNYPRIAELLQAVSKQNLPQNLLGLLALRNAETAVAKHDNALALHFLTEGLPTLFNIAQASPEVQQKILKTRAQVLEQMQDYASAATQLMHLEVLLTDSGEITDNRTRLWKLLTLLTLQNLEKLYPQLTNTTEQGWVALALLSRNEEASPLMKMKWYEDWKQEWPYHPALSDEPPEIALLKTPTTEAKLSSVALLLPLSGPEAKRGQSLRDGFLYEYFTTSDDRPALQIYDTAAGTPLQELLDQAATEGAERIVGPVLSENIAAISNSFVQIPVITLGAQAKETLLTDDLMSLGLSRDSLATQIADYIYRLNVTKVIVFYSADTSGTEMRQLFRQTWEDKGGTILKQVRLPTNERKYGNLVKKTLHANLSERRQRVVNSIIGQSSDFDVRRRKDVEAFVLFTTPAQARLIKPLLEFYFAGELPVVGGPRVISGISDPDQNKDLRGIVFPDVPGVMHPDKTLQRFASQYLHSNWEKQWRDYNLGRDAFRVNEQLDTMTDNPGGILFSLAGFFSVSDNRLIRNLQWYKMNSQTIEPLDRLLPREAETTLAIETLATSESTADSPVKLPAAEKPSATE